MVIHVACPNWTQRCFYSLKSMPLIIIIILFTLGKYTAASNTKCPFHHLFHFGDGFTDVGNSIFVKPYGPILPAARLPYGITFPGKPSGRWSNGLVIFDYAANDFGLPNITPYWTMNTSMSYDGVIFSVARSTVLDHGFFASRDIFVPPYIVPLKLQISWFKKYFKTLCSKPKECAKILRDAVVFFGDIESNDLGYALFEGKSIQEVKTYVPHVIEKSIQMAREMIMLGAKRVLIPESAPLGCYPYILTTLSSDNPADYDELGCLKSVNDLILFKNKKLKQAVEDLRVDFPETNIFFGRIYEVFRILINQTMASGPNALKACCGIGGNYNYNHKKFCGSPKVPACPDPDEYVFWDGIHLTQEAIARIERIVFPSAVVALNCTSS